MVKIKFKTSNTIYFYALSNKSEVPKDNTKLKKQIHDILLPNGSTAEAWESEPSMTVVGTEEVDVLPERVTKEIEIGKYGYTKTYPILPPKSKKCKNITEFCNLLMDEMFEYLRNKNRR